MEPKGVVTFHRGDLPSTSFAAFERMRANGILCDLKIRVQNHTFEAHRVILAAGIPYFQSPYTSYGVETAVEDISRGDLDPKAMESLLRYAYTGKIDISLDNVYYLLRASNFLQLTEVFDACVEFLVGKLDDDVAIRIHDLAREFAIPTLTESTNHYILKYFEKISRHDDFLNFPHSSIREIISEDDLNVRSEETVFEAVIKWVKASLSERHEMMPELLSEVRMIYLPADYLVNRVATEDLVRSSELCMGLLEDVKNYHLLPKGRAPFSKLKTRPRKFGYFKGGIYSVFYCYAAGYSVHHCDFDNGRMSPNLASVEGPHGSVFGVAAVNEKVYMFHEKTIRTFHVETLQWEVLKRPTHACVKGAAFVTHGDLIYCFGSSSADFSNKVRCFDTRKNTWLQQATMNSGRHNSAAASLGEYIYVTGGFWGYMVPSYMSLMGYSGGTAVERYSPSRKQCKKVAPMLTPRESHFCASVNAKIYVCGGRGVAGNFLNTAEVYDPLTHQWSFISSIPSARSSFSFVSHNGKIYAVEADRGAVCFEIFDSGSNRWNAGLPLRNEGGLEGGLRFAVSFPPDRC